MRIAQAFQGVGSQIVAYQVGIPDRAVEESLHPIGSAFSSLLSELPAILPFNGTDDAFEKGECSSSGFGTHKMWGNTSMEMFEFLAPSPDIQKGRWRSPKTRCCSLHLSPCHSSRSKCTTRLSM